MSVEKPPGGAPDTPWPTPYPPGQPSGQQPYPPVRGTPPPGTPPSPYASGQWEQPGAPTGGPGGERRGKRTAIALVTAAAVAAVAVIAGVVVLGGDGGGSSGEDGGSSGGEARAGGDRPASPSPEPTDDHSIGADPDDPRSPVLPVPDPVVAPDWQVQRIFDRHNAFDVPPDWEVGSESRLIGYEDSREDGNGDLAVAMSAVSTYMDDWCDEADGPSWRAAAGTKGGQGATSTEEAAENEARVWALAAYDQEQRGTLRVTEPEPFESEYGITGHTATATITDVPEDPDAPCGTSEGEVVTVSYIDSENNLATWVLLRDTGFEGAVDDETVELMMNSLRPYPEESQE